MVGGHFEEETQEESGSEDRKEHNALSYGEQEESLREFNLLPYFVNKNLSKSSVWDFILKEWILFCLCQYVE